MKTPYESVFSPRLRRFRCGAALLPGVLALALWSGCTAYVGAPEAASYDQPAPAIVSASDALPADVGVTISSASDFYEPLSPYGDWLTVGSYGRCWRPRGVAAGWRPYTNGHWEWTDEGWYWASDDPWGWATCHYGRWDEDDDGRWFWVPRTEWAPAWVVWREGDGYVGWAPDPPRGGGARVNVEVRPRNFVFIDERHFEDPIRPDRLIVNNTTILNRTVNITNTRVVNRTVFNQGPRPEAIEQRSGRRITAVPVRQVRAREEQKIAPELRRSPARSPVAARPASVPQPTRPTVATPAATNPASRYATRPSTARPAESRPREPRAVPVPPRSPATTPTTPHYATNPATSRPAETRTPQVIESPRPAPPQPHAGTSTTPGANEPRAREARPVESTLHSAVPSATSRPAEPRQRADRVTGQPKPAPAVTAPRVQPETRRPEAGPPRNVPAANSRPAVRSESSKAPATAPARRVPPPEQHGKPGQKTEEEPPDQKKRDEEH